MNLNIQAKPSKLIFNCESSEAKRSEANMFNSKKNYFEAKNLNIEVNRVCSIVWKFISKWSEHVYIKELKYWSEAKQVNTLLNCESSEAKRAKLLPKIKLARRSEVVYFKLAKKKQSEQVGKWFCS